VAVLSLAFGVLQVVHRPISASSGPAAPAAEEQTLAASAIPTGPGGSLNASISVGSPAQTTGEIQEEVKVLEANYTVQPGDTLNRIAARFGTTVERIQAWNDLPDPRALRVGARLVIPPPLPSEP
jgi:LysM repeat protein